MKTVTSREFFHSPTSVKVLHPGQSLTVTDKGKPSFTVIKAGQRPKRSIADLKRDAVKTGRGKLDLVKGILDLRSQ